MKYARQIAVWLLLLALPLQGIAAYAPMARCGDDHAAAMQQVQEAHADHHAMATPADADHAAAAGHQCHDGDCQSSDSAGHSCCNHVFTGAAPATVPYSPEAPRVITLRVSLLSTLFIPELPQRPPRA